ncbi:MULTISPECIES: anaerobic ribonucleoside-triphosphate reductase activating protein [Desulfotignum]|jgi:pyruvate formate lyase activating enzyme|uniref:[formate-C-acetyltransferase]-activating enzyme NrdG n=1 Tax=Desulfotignum phosphitoxidans DSM 13687 TaxID=1286635 RepID=S0FTE3_9BACT|nr:MULTISPECIES: anaerobic ribonucleoside-triphosphate reductase activating protein [Desulfotignum]EMS78363.1 [formate-C-acetyltransferase]-activating enzyme NrdG [Desulfotignum phosphitoxidans DSM 13687]
MHIGGFQKNSLIDFPGTISCVVFTMGCNFICPYCHNPELAAGPANGTGRLDTTDIFSFLTARKGLVDGVVITGGEPCLQKNLMDFIQQIKQMGLAVKLDTNGSRPAVLSRLLDRSLVDYVAMDIKTGADKYPDIMKPSADMDSVSQSMGLIMDFAPAYEFRTTCVRPFINAQIMEQIAGQIKGAKKYVLQKCVRHVPMMDPQFSQNPDHFFSDREILELKSIVEGAVQEVQVR